MSSVLNIAAEAAVFLAWGRAVEELEIPQQRSPPSDTPSIPLGGLGGFSGVAVKEKLVQL